MPSSAFQDWPGGSRGPQHHRYTYTHVKFWSHVLPANNTKIEDFFCRPHKTKINTEKKIKQTNCFQTQLLVVGAFERGRGPVININYYRLGYDGLQQFMHILISCYIGIAGILKILTKVGSYRIFWLTGKINEPSKSPVTASLIDTYQAWEEYIPKSSIPNYSRAVKFSYDGQEFFFKLAHEWDLAGVNIGGKDRHLIFVYYLQYICTDENNFVYLSMIFWPLNFQLPKTFCTETGWQKVWIHSLSSAKIYCTQNSVKKSMNS